MSKPAVRQMRGPGMNKGLKKPRHAQFNVPPPSKTSSAVENAGARGSSKPDYSKNGPSYLSKNVWD